MTGFLDLLREAVAGATSYLEIGVQEGSSLSAVVATNRAIDLVLCDDWGRRAGGTGRGSHDHIAQKLQRMNHSGQVAWVDGRSQDVLGSFLRSAGITVDVSLVDGSHLVEDAFTDLVTAWPATRRHLIVHDIRMSGVWEALCRFVPRDGGDIRSVQTSWHGWGAMVLSR